MKLTPEKAKWLWMEMNKYRTLWNDFTRNDYNSWFANLVRQDSYWLEVLKDGYPVGVVYWTDLLQFVDANVHCMFFDRDLATKTELCRQIAYWFFLTFPEMTRMTATIPSIYHTTSRLMKRLGFKEEGRKRQSLLMYGNKVDELIYGLLSQEMI